MSEAKDPAIKLFGRTIPRPESSPAADGDSAGAGETQDCDEAPSCERQIDSKQDEKSHTFTSQESKDPNESALTDDNPKTPIADNETPASTTRKTEEEQSEASNLQDKTPKKPDKVLPCPRCNSVDTKFCYYNNYNISQPRHFCKNCQRYWTAGGSMRNVPVGAGRRKNKNSASHYRHITVSEALQNGRIEPLNGAHFPTVRPNGTVLSFGSDTPLCESMASVLIADKTSQNCARNGLHKSENPKVSVPYRVGESSDDQSSMSSVTVANVKDGNGRSKPTHVMMQNCHSYPPQVPVFAGPPWPYPLNTAQWFPSSGVLPPGYPTPFYPALPYWGCPVQIPWPAPWVAPPLSASPISPTLGKHCRDENSSKQSDVGEEEEEEEKEKKRESSTEKLLWIPKTLRIDDPGDAAKSSIWATLGIKHEKCDSAIGGGGKGGLFKAFQSKTNENSDSSDTSPVLQANPAALSRSRNFHESS